MTTTRIRRRYSDLSRLETFLERFDYLRLGGSIGIQTFGYDRYLNQSFYRSREWARARDDVILRDNACDLGIPGREINARLVVHHLNPISIADIVAGADEVLDPEFLICTSVDTHLAIHYGDETLLPRDPVKRRPGDTTLWMFQ